jgi:hypothetical protein
MSRPPKKQAHRAWRPRLLDDPGLVILREPAPSARPGNHLQPTDTRRLRLKRIVMRRHKPISNSEIVIFKTSPIIRKGAVTTSLTIERQVRNVDRRFTIPRGKLREHRENRLKRGFVEPNTEAKLLAEAFLQAVSKIADLERRVAVSEGKPIDEESELTHSLR